MRHTDIMIRMLRLVLIWLSISGVVADNAFSNQCRPLVADGIVGFECGVSSGEISDSLCVFRMRLDDGFNGYISIDGLRAEMEGLKVTAVSPDTVVVLHPMIDRYCRSCDFVSDYPLRKHQDFRINIPDGLFKICPGFEEVDTIDVEEDLLRSFCVAGAWHKSGSVWRHQGMFSVIDDDSLDGQIPSSKHSKYTYGYWSLLYPLLESLDIKGNLAVEGRKIGIDYTPVKFNDNGLTLVRMQDEKGWDLLSHSMECLGELDNNWIVDDLDTPLALRLLEEGPNKGTNQQTISIYDKISHRQYWPNVDNSEWEETPKRWIKPYVGNYETRRNVMYNPDFDIDWHWGQTKSRAEEYGIKYVGFVTHNSTSSHALVSEIRRYFPFGLSDIGAVNINYPPMLSSGVRSGLEGQSMAGYNGNSTDNTFNEDHYKRFCAQVDEAAEKGGWIIFNLHTYREVWLNSLPGALVSEGGSYPDEWVIPMKGMDSANDPLTPPAHLGISDWSEWYPCPGTRLEMMWKVLKYAKEKGLRNVTCSEGFSIMGNKVSVGYYNNGYKFGMDIFGLRDTEEVYPHYIVSATDEVSYYNPFIMPEMTIELDSLADVMLSGRFLIDDGSIVWNTPDPTGVTLEVIDLTGAKTASSPINSICLDGRHGVCIVCAKRSGSVLDTVKLVR